MDLLRGGEGGEVLLDVIEGGGHRFVEIGGEGLFAGHFTRQKAEKLRQEVAAKLFPILKIGVLLHPVKHRL